jgi:hypothetical protein
MRAPWVLGPVVLLALAGCGAEAGPRDAGPVNPTTGTTSTTPAPAPPVETDPSPTAPRTTSKRCGPHVVPDGTWDGPLALDVRGRGRSTTFTSSTGRGTIHLVVAGGKVTAGTWSVRWTSDGHVETPDAAARVHVRGTITGTATGAAARPRMEGSWRIVGRAVITKPVHDTAPIDETGPDRESLAVTTQGCDAVTGTFRPSFPSKDMQATFSGRATWTGTRP